MKLKIKAKAFIGCLMASLLFSTPLLATGVQLSLAGVSNANKESLKAYVDKLLDRSANNSILFSAVDLLMYKEIFYVSLMKDCKEKVCNYDKDEVDAVLDENTDRATKVVYARQVEKGATKDDFNAWVEKNLCSQGCDYLNMMKGSFKDIKVIIEGSLSVFVMHLEDDSKIGIVFNHGGEILCFKYDKVDAHHEYYTEYIITPDVTSIKAYEYTLFEDLSDSTEDKSVSGGMVTNFNVTVTLDHAGSVIKRTGKIYVYDKLLSFRGYQFELKDDTLSSAVNGDYVSIEELSDNRIVQNSGFNHVDTESALYAAIVANKYKESFDKVKVLSEGSAHMVMMDIDDDSKVKLTFDASAGKILGVKYNGVDVHDKGDGDYILIPATTIKDSESTLYEYLSDRTEGENARSIASKFEISVCIDQDGNLIKKVGSIGVYDNLLPCRDSKFELQDDALKSAANRDYVSSNELLQ
ncbi:MAG: hypothetical protein QS721_09875 [Candidatus Endonucleobacter sp. (ex Gigantidas childressi)]|nr:hypothetical protein [Candidatus Endonucleobacter sp. (ex Gigantidas childressi)]